MAANQNQSDGFPDDTAADIKKFTALAKKFVGESNKIDCVREARGFLTRCMRPLIFLNGQFREWGYSNCYEGVSKEVMFDKVNLYLQSKKFEYVTPKQIENVLVMLASEIRVTPPTITDAFGNTKIATTFFLTPPSGQHNRKYMPGWETTKEFADIPAIADPFNGWDASKVIILQDKLLYLSPTKSTEGNEIEVLPHPPTHWLYSGFSLGIKYDADAVKNIADSEWMAWGTRNYAHFPYYFTLLRRWNGLIITPRLDLHYILLLTGPPRAGKGTALHVMELLVGGENVASPKLSTFGGKNANALLVDKPLGIFRDVRVDKRNNVSAILENILAISSGEAVQIEDKYEKAYSGVLPTRLAMASQSKPAIYDEGGLESRWLHIEHKISYEGKEDRGLQSRLSQEGPIILADAIENAKHLMLMNSIHDADAPINTSVSASIKYEPLALYQRCRDERFVFDSTGEKKWHTPVRCFTFEFMRYCIENAETLPKDKTEIKNNLIKVLSEWGIDKPRRPSKNDGTKNLYPLSYDNIAIISDLDENQTLQRRGCKEVDRLPSDIDPSCLSDQ